MSQCECSLPASAAPPTRAAFPSSAPLAAKTPLAPRMPPLESPAPITAALPPRRAPENNLWSTFVHRTKFGICLTLFKEKSFAGEEEDGIPGIDLLVEDHEGQQKNETFGAHHLVKVWKMQRELMVTDQWSATPFYTKTNWATFTLA